MNFTLRQLQVFLEIVKWESVTKAAEELNMTQPAVSIQLRNFQAQFDVPLTEIIGKKLYVTEFGISVAAIAENVLQDAEALQYRTKAYSGLLTGRLKISSASTGKYVIPYFLSEFLPRHPGIDLVLDVTNKQKVVESLRQNMIDFALVSVLPEGIEICEELLLENKLFLIGNKPEFDPEAPLIYRESGSATRRSMDRYFGGVLERKSLELTSNEAVKQAVIAGLGYSILPLIGIKNELAVRSLFIVPSPGLPIITTWRLVWLKDKKLSPAASAYLDFLREEKERIIGANFQWYLDYPHPDQGRPETTAADC